VIVSELPPEVLDILVCPACHGSLAWDYETSELCCMTTSCGLAYPVRDGIPVMLIDQARRPNAGFR